MSAAPPLTLEETARIGKDIYERLVLQKIQPSDKGKVVAIDVRSEAWVLDETGLAAAQKLTIGRPDAEVWPVRVGYATYHRMGGHVRRSNP